MADFKIAFDITNANEGGYANNPNDHGGETYAGISRKNWPNWPGWIVIDVVKKETSDIHLINKSLNGSQSLQGLVQSFYKSNFWDALKLDDVNDQQIANAVYDFGVNSGVGTSAKIIQRVAGANPDGVIGGETVRAINNYPSPTLLGLFNTDREKFYRNLAQKPGQSQFLHSWLSRIKPYVV